MRRSIPLSVRFRRFDRLDRNRFTGRIHIHYFAGRLLTVDRVLTNAVVLAVVRAALIWNVVGLITVRFNAPLIAIVRGGSRGTGGELVSGRGCAGKTMVCSVGKL